MNEWNVVLLETEDSLVLIMRGEHTKETVINSAIAANEISQSDSETWLACEDINVAITRRCLEKGMRPIITPRVRMLKAHFWQPVLCYFKVESQLVS
ncbi:hypothetical protein K7H99_20685 (plasmid) [Providencia rettgeri]|uniref:hypothetical protein n=1 Tax=Providencia rettgeri TaxID=587 RepID=UPI001CA69DD8|nr:hypothetical protein K7H99_20685 [Providencia rettgeri]